MKILDVDGQDGGLLVSGLGGRPGMVGGEGDGPVKLVVVSEVLWVPGGAQLYHNLP